MDPVPPILIIIIFLAVGAGLFLAWQADKKRREELLLWATARGWNMRPGKQGSMHRDFAGLKVFEKGHSRSAKNVIEGDFEGHPVTLLDYKYVTGHGKNRTTHNRGMVILHCDFPTVPLFIRRENPLDRVGEFFGADDIDFESAEFSRKFFVKSHDRKWAFDVVHTRTMEYLLKAPSFTVEFGFGEIAVYKTGKFDPDGYDRALRMARRMHELIPDFVVRQMKGEGRT
jgi:hypothetical protein